MIKYTIHLYTKSGNSKKVELFAGSMQEARNKAQASSKGSSISMAWYNWPFEYSR